VIFSRTLLKRHSVLPGFDLALGLALLYTSLIVLIPLSAAFLKTFTLTWQQFLEATLFSLAQAVHLVQKNCAPIRRGGMNEGRNAGFD